MTFGELCAGIGGIGLGLERAGLTARWAVENAPFQRDVLRKHWPGLPLLWDVRECGDDNLERVDLIAAGFPCQPVSVAGKQLVDADERWLWPDIVRIIRELRPSYVLLENTPGLLTRGLGLVLGDLASSGYDAEWDCVSAAMVGAPHKRERIWIVAYADGVRELESEGIFADVRRRIGDGTGWPTEPDVARVAARVPRGMDRRAALGNAVVSQIPEVIGRAIMESAGA